MKTAEKIVTIEIAGLTDRQIDIRLKKLAEIEQTIKALEADATKIKTEIRDSMGDTEQHQTAHYIIKNQTITSNRLDTKALKADLPNIYAEYSKASTSQRFTYKAV